MTVALDPAVRQLIDAIAQQGAPSFAQAGPEGPRAIFESFTQLQLPAHEVARTIDIAYGAHPEQVLRVLVPDGPPPLPVVVYLHGGGFVAGSPDMVDGLARALANRAGAIVVAAGYRRAPEAKFPAAAHDAVAALRWVAEHIGAYGGDPERLALAGDSSGGNLAAVAALDACAAGTPLVRALALAYPLIDPRADTPSRREFAEDYLQTTADLDWFADQYLASPDEALNPLVAVNRWPSYQGLPPTLVATAEYDPLRDEAEDFGRQLGDAGVKVRSLRFDGLVHGVLSLSGAVPRQAEMLDAIADFLRTEL